jgi:CrcB protein
MGIFMGISKTYPFIPETIRLAMVTGFLGGLTTFSTFSGEAITLLGNEEYFWASIHIVGHLSGSLLATVGGIYITKIFFSWVIS